MALLKPLFLAFLSVALLLQSEAAVAQSGAASGEERREPMGPPHQVKTAEELSRFMSYYYLYPRPNLTSEALDVASKQGMMKASGAFIGFFGFMFAYNPKELPIWVLQIERMDNDSKAIMSMALWYATTPAARNYAKKIARSISPDYEKALSQGVGTGLGSILSMPITDGGKIDMLWSSFFYSGDKRYVERIIDLAGSWKTKGLRDPKAMLLGNHLVELASWSLVSNARQHRRVMAILEEAKRTKPSMQAQLDAMIAKAKS